MKMGINLSAMPLQYSSLEMVPFVQRAGFDACFWDARETGATLEQIAQKIKEYGLIFQSIHAPFIRMRKMWEKDRAGDTALEKLFRCVENCSKEEVPLLICHVFIGFGRQQPNEIGIERFSRLLDKAQQEGVRIAFENTEGEAYLQAVRDALWQHPAAGFCIDTGHEMCYNAGTDMIAKYGSKLIATHLDDNLGITGHRITWLDDAHLMPFDGKADWASIAERLAKANYHDILTFELTNLNKPWRHTQDRYKKYDAAAFMQRAYEQGCRVAALLEAAQQRQASSAETETAH